MPQPKRIPSRVLALMTSSLWAVREDALQRMLAIAHRDITLQSMLAYDDEDDEGIEIGGASSTGYQVIDGVGIIPFIGPAFRYSSWMTEICGATSYEKMGGLHRQYIADPAVKAILFEENSPGGEVTGCADFARQVRDGCDIKPTVAFIDGDASSAAYWIASACDHIVISRTGTAGCIGVVAMMRDRTKADEMAGIQNIEIVSSQTPNKRPDPTSDSGRAQIQRQVDDTAAVFLADVADYRGVDVQEVADRFGRGDVFVGRKAVKLGLADEIGTFDEVLAELAASQKSALSDSRSPLILPATSAAKARKPVASKATRGSKR